MVDLGLHKLDPKAWEYIVAVSLGSVFFGACTYIGNGPNFMVKSIAESSGVKCPSFFGYVVQVHTADPDPAVRARLVVVFKMTT